jgi:large subunit ribosomal protein L21
MLAVIELGGNQFTVKVWDIIDVKKQDQEVNATITTNALLLSDEEGKETKVGTPTIEGSKIELKVLEQFKGEKVRVFKMKSKKRHMKNWGFRPHITKLEVLSIV